jgi:RNA-directed DNA polymerase
LKYTKKYDESRQLQNGGCLYEDRVELKCSTGAHSTSSMCQNKENDGDEYASKLLEKILDRNNLNLAYKRVKANKGSHGVDGMAVSELLSYLKQNGAQIKQSILEGTYRPNPVRRVSIPKPDGKVRLLGIPTVLDRELERRGLKFCRYADDINIYVKSKKSADRVMQSITKFIEDKLKLKVNSHSIIRKRE